MVSRRSGPCGSEHGLDDATRGDGVRIPLPLAEDSECSLDGPTFAFLSCNLNRGPLPTGNGWVGTGS